MFLRIQNKAKKYLFLLFMGLFVMCFLLSSFISFAATQYHKHSTISTTETTTDYDESVNTPEMSSIYGGCYTEAVRHYHNSSCPTTICTGTDRVTDSRPDGEGGSDYLIQCDTCGGGTWHADNSSAGKKCGSTIYHCGYNNGQLLGYKATACSKGAGQVDSYTTEVIFYYQQTDGTTYEMKETKQETIPYGMTIDYSTYPVEEGFYYAGLSTCESLLVDPSHDFTSGQKTVTFNSDVIVKIFYNRNKSTLDLNAVLDGDYIQKLPDGVTAKIKINNITVETNATDFKQSVCYNAPYSIELAVPEGYTYQGIDTNTYGMSINPASSLTGNKPNKDIHIAPSFKSNVYAITLNRTQFNNTGTDVIYLKYGVGYYSDTACTKKITKITVPNKDGYTFKGYEGANGLAISADGTIIASDIDFSSDTILYATGSYQQNPKEKEPEYQSPDNADYGGQTEWMYDGTADEQIFTAPLKGYYQFDLYGAQGANSTKAGGKGGYVGGEIFLEKGEKIYAGIYPQGTGTMGLTTRGGTGSILYTYTENQKENSISIKSRPSGQIYRVDYWGNGFTNSNINWDIPNAILMNIYISENRTVAYYQITTTASTNLVPSNATIIKQTITPIQVISIAGGGSGGFPHKEGNAGGTTAGQVSLYSQSISSKSYGSGGGGGASLGSGGYAILHTHIGGCWGVVGSDPINASYGLGSGCNHTSWTSNPVGPCGCGAGHGHCPGFCYECGGHFAYCGGHHTRPIYGWACGKTEGVSVDSEIMSYGGSSYYNNSVLSGINSNAGIQSGNGRLVVTMKAIPVAAITLDKNFGQWEGDTGTIKIWYYSDNIEGSGGGKYYDNSEITNPIEDFKINIPNKKGWTFEGYYTEPDGKGTLIIDRDGNILLPEILENITLKAFYVDETSPEEIELKFKKADGNVYVPNEWTKQTVYSTIVAKDYATGLFYKYKVQDMPSGGEQYTSNVAGFMWEYGYLANNDDITYSYNNVVSNKTKYDWFKSDTGYTNLVQHNDLPETLLDNAIAKYRVDHVNTGWYLVKGWVKDDAIKSGFYTEEYGFSPEKNHVSSYPSENIAYSEIKIDKMNPQIDSVDYWEAQNTVYHTINRPNDVYDNTTTKNIPRAKIVIAASDKHSGVKWYYMSKANVAPNALKDPLAKENNIDPTQLAGTTWKQENYFNSWQTQDTFYVTETGWYYFWVMDEVGNVSSVQKKYIDLTAPTMTDVYTLSTHKYRLTYADGYSKDYNVKREFRDADKIFYYPWVNGNFRIHFTAIDDKSVNATENPGVGIYRMAVRKGGSVNDPIVHEVKWNTGDYTQKREIDYVVEATANEGTQLWTIQVWDRNGNTSYITVATRIDNTAPTISDTSEIYQPKIEDIKLDQIESFLNNADNFNTKYNLVTLDYKGQATTNDTSGMETAYLDVIDTSDSRIHKIYVLDETASTEEKEYTMNAWEGNRVKTLYTGSHNLYTDFKAATNLGRFELVADTAGNLRNTGTQVTLYKYILPSSDNTGIDSDKKNTDPYGFGIEGPSDPYDPNSPTHIPSIPSKPGSEAGFKGENGSGNTLDDPNDRDDDIKNPYDGDSDGGTDYTEKDNDNGGNATDEELPDGNGLPDSIDGKPPVQPTIPEETKTSQNFSIMTYIKNDESVHYNVSGDTGNVYFQLGEKGHVIVYTIGYVEKIQLDFMSMGEESAREIEAGLLSAKYNLGTSSGTHARYIHWTKGQKIGPLPDDKNGVPFAVKYDLGSAWGSDGTAILIPPYHEMQDDLSKEPNADGLYPKKWELRYYKAIGHKYNSETGEKQAEYDKNSYIIWSTHELDVHYRVTHES